MKRRIGSKGQIVIPKEIRERFDIQGGDTLHFEFSEKEIRIRPEPSPDAFVDRFVSLPKGKKLKKRLDWKALLDEEYRLRRGR